MNCLISAIFFIFAEIELIIFPLKYSNQTIGSYRSLFKHLEKFDSKTNLFWIYSIISDQSVCAVADLAGFLVLPEATVLQVYGWYLPMDMTNVSATSWLILG